MIRFWHRDLRHVGANETKELDYGLSQGDNVRITQGTFAGLEAVVTQILPVRERVKSKKLGVHPPSSYGRSKHVSGSIRELRTGRLGLLDYYLGPTSRLYCSTTYRQELGFQH